jgi:hypothetical protein
MRKFHIVPEQVVKSALESLAKDPYDEKYWFEFNCIVGTRPLYPALRPEVPRSLAQFDLLHLYTTKPNDCSRFLEFVSQVAASSRDMEFVKKIWEQCLKLSQQLNGVNPATEEEHLRQKHLGLAIADAALRFSSLTSEHKVGVTELIRMITDVVKRCPAFAKYFIASHGAFEPYAG